MMSRGNGLPKGWVWTRLGEIATLEYGKGLRADKRDSGGTIPVYGSNGLVGYHSEALTQRPCVVVGRKGASGCVHLSKSPCWPIDTTYYIEPPEGVDLSFLFSLLSGLGLRSLDRSTAIPGLNRDDAYAVEFGLPPLPEQQRIVAKIEELFTRLDTGVKALKKVKAQLKAYRQAVLRDAFEGKLTAEWREAHKGEMEPASVLLERLKKERRKNAKGKVKELPPLDTSDLPELPQGWVWTRLENCVDILDGQRVPINAKEREKRITGKPVFERYPYYGATGQVGWIDGYLFDEELLLVGEDGAPFLEPTKNKAYIIKGKGWVNNHAHVLRAIAGVSLNSFLCHYLNIFDYNGYVTGTTRLKLNQAPMRRISIPLPPLPEQRKIVEEIERCFSVADQIEKTVEQGLKQAERLRRSILKRAFEGKLVSQDPTDEPAERLLARIKAEKAKRVSPLRARVK